jgi:hypothetical protein
MGTWLLERARVLLGMHDEIIANFRAPDIAGHVRLGTPDDYALVWLPEILAGFAQARTLGGGGGRLPPLNGSAADVRAGGAGRDAFSPPATTRTGGGVGDAVARAAPLGRFRDACRA